MQKLFENWREFRKDTLNEAKNVEYIGAFTLNDSPFLRQMYIVDGQAYYTSAGTGGVTRKGDLVQFGGILEVDVVPGPDGGNIATRLHRDQYISQIRKGGQSFGEVYRADWVLKNPAGKDVGDLSQDIRNLEAEKKGRIINKDDINKLLKKRGILRADWAVQHGLRHIDFPGVTKVKPRARPPSGLNRRERAKWRKDRHDKEWRDRAKGWDDDSLYPEKGFKKNDPKVQKLIDKELRLLGELPPEKTFKQFIIKYGTKIPIIGRFLKIAFATTIGSMVLLEAEKAYAKEGPIGAMKVIADNGADFLPVIGDIKGAIEILSILSQQDWNVPDELKHVRPDVFFESQKTKENKLLFENWREFVSESNDSKMKIYVSLYPMAKHKQLHASYTKIIQDAASLALKEVIAGYSDLKSYNSFKRFIRSFPELKNQTESELKSRWKMYLDAAVKELKKVPVVTFHDDLSAVSVRQMKHSAAVFYRKNKKIHVNAFKIFDQVKNARSRFLRHALKEEYIHAAQQFIYEKLKATNIGGLMFKKANISNIFLPYNPDMGMDLKFYNYLKSPQEFHAKMLNFKMDLMKRNPKMFNSIGEVDNKQFLNLLKNKNTLNRHQVLKIVNLNKFKELLRWFNMLTSEKYSGRYVDRIA